LFTKLTFWDRWGNFKRE